MFSECQAARQLQTVFEEVESGNNSVDGPLITHWTDSDDMCTMVYGYIMDAVDCTYSSFLWLCQASIACQLPFLNSCLICQHLC